MARIQGDFSASVNYEILKQAPLDARALVNLKSDLIDPGSWKFYEVYSGMLVSVGKDPTEENNGVYILRDENNYLVETSWVKLTSNEDFQKYQQSLEEQLSKYITEDDIKDFARLQVIEGELPVEGESNTLYILQLDGNWEEYIYINSDWVLIGSSSLDLSNYYTKQEIDVLLQGKQGILVSGENIKTIEGMSILGAGNLDIKPSADEVADALEEGYGPSSNNYLVLNGNI